MKVYDGWWSIGDYKSVTPKIIKQWYGSHCTSCGAEFTLKVDPTNRFDGNSGNRIEKYSLICPNGHQSKNKNSWCSDTTFQWAD